MRQRFVPFGTVSSRAEFRDYAPSARQQEREERDAAHVFQALIRLVEAFEIDDGVFFLAWELARMPRQLSPEERRATLMLLLATLVALRQGSTCLPIEEGLGPLLTTLCSPAVEEALGATAQEIFHQIKRLIHGERLTALIAIDDEAQGRKPLVLRGQRLYQQRMFHYERRLIEAISERLLKQGASIQTDGIEAHLGAIWRSAHGTTLTDEQRYAVLTCVHLPLAIITGGPGTGKTSIVVAILRLMTRLGVQPEEIALAAPTGKAANRMLESIDAQWRAIAQRGGEPLTLVERLPKPQTVHRLLGYSRHTQSYHHQEHAPLNARVVIVDEASMLDIFVMERLVRALRADAHLVLLGDAEQLPSVEAGSVLRDMTALEGSTPGPWRALAVDAPTAETARAVQADPQRGDWTVRLTVSHRMRDDDPDGRAILRAAQSMRRGDVHTLLDGEASEGGLVRCAHAEAITWRGAEWLELEELDATTHSIEQVGVGLGPFLERWCADRAQLEQITASAGRIIVGMTGDEVTDEDELIALTEALRITQDARLLTLTRVYPTGTRALNEQIMERLRALQGARADERWLPGAPVMMLRNDYEREIFNGDQGVLMLARVGWREELMAFFPRGPSFVGYSLDSLRTNLEVSFAMTVHKSQGSEFERVAFVLPAEPLPLMTREVLYTAMTRSRRGALVVGNRTTLSAGAIARMQRFSALGESLSRAL